MTTSGLVAILALTACTGDKSATAEARTAATTGAAAGGAPGGQPDTRGATGQKPRGAGGPQSAGARSGGPGGRGPLTLVLAATDIAPVVRAPIEAGFPVNGDLRPVEILNIRSRLEGNLDAVNVREGQRVAKGQLLARFESLTQESDRKSADADRASAQSELTTAQWNLDQSRELFKAGAIAEQAVRAAEQSVAASRAKVAATDARIRTTSLSVTDTRVLAPLTGVVEKKLVETGEHVTRGATMFTMVRNDVLELAASIPARNANAVHEGQKVHFVADGRAFEGSVTRISPTVDPATRALTIYVQIPNVGGLLRGNTFASGRVVGRSVPDALIIPTQALHQTPESARPFVYRIENGAVASAPVGLGIVDDEKGIAEVLDGLQEGDKVIVGNVGTVGRGMKVEILGEKNGRKGNAGAQGAAGQRAPRGTAAGGRRSNAATQ